MRFSLVLLLAAAANAIQLRGDDEKSGPNQSDPAFLKGKEEAAKVVAKQ